MFCSVYALMLAFSLTSNCPQASPWEVSYQALHAVDFAQTVQIARSPKCYEEKDLVTARIIGHHPTPSKVAGMWAAESMVHYAISGWLDRSSEANGGAWTVARDTWHVVGVAWEAFDIGHNNAIGLKPFGGNRCEPTEKIARRR